MGFASKAQQRHMHKSNPDVAKEMEKTTPNEPLPERIGKTRRQTAEDQLHRGMQGKQI